MPTTDHQVTLTLPDNFVGQLLDGLSVLIEQWDATARYHEHGDIGAIDGEEDIIIRECRDAHEANTLADWYRDIAGLIRTQRNQQRDATP